MPTSSWQIVSEGQTHLQHMTYLSGYPTQIIDQVSDLLAQEKLGVWLAEKYPHCHQYSNEKALYEYTIKLKNRFLRQSSTLSKVVYDPKVHVIHHALGVHAKIPRVQGKKLKTKKEIRVSTVFRQAPQAFLDMILIHELAHFKEPDHNRAFYRLCRHMAPNYHQLELDTRIYLTFKECVGSLY